MASLLLAIAPAFRAMNKKTDQRPGNDAIAAKTWILNPKGFGNIYDLFPAGKDKLVLLKMSGPTYSAAKREAGAGRPRRWGQSLGSTSRARSAREKSAGRDDQLPREE